jgi:ATPase family associated with various cellular activities (AAA)
VEDWRGVLGVEIDRVLQVDGVEGPRNGSSRVEDLRAAFGLSAFEIDLLVLCAGHAVDPKVASRIGGRPTFGYAFAQLVGGHMDAAAPTRPLRFHRLLVIAPGPPLEAALAIDERVLNYLLGVPTIDERLLVYTLASPTSTAQLTISQQRLADRLEPLLAGGNAIQLHGGEAGTRLAVLHAAAVVPTLLIRAGALSGSATELDLVQRLVEREVLLGGSLATVLVDSFDGPDVCKSVRAFADGLSVPVAILTPDTISLTRPCNTFAVPPATAAERHELWTSALRERTFDEDLDRIAQQFQLEPTQITALAQTVDVDTTSDELWTACRDASRPRLDDLARRIEPNATWESLVLPPEVQATLKDVVIHLEHRHQVHERWGFARGDERGQAITALFHGPSGTGKTHAAEVIARAAKLDLYHVDLSQVVDKYIGETEKRLRRIFDAAEQGGAVLLFDEADALFGKRASVERGSDRWANLEVSYLLQRMERYRGLAILTTNAKDALDRAFLRRLRFVVPFAFPEATLRAELWRRVFPADVPLSGIEPTKLARLQFTGANIKNVATRAAFQAAHERTAITMPHLIAAARSEFAKLEIPFPELDVRNWAVS